MHICDVSKPSANVCEGAKHWIFLIFAMFPRLSKSSAYVWNILQASPGYFLLQEGGGGNVKLICEGTNQCICVMFPSPQPMFGIFLASPGDFPVTRGGGEM